MSEMRRRFESQLRGVVLLCVVLLTLSAVTAHTPPPTAEAMSSSIRQEIHNLRNSLSRVQGDIEQYKQDLTQLQGEKEGVSRELNQVQLELRQVEAELEEARIALDLAELEVMQAEEDFDHAQAELDRRIDLLHRRVRAMYELGTVTYLEVLLTATDFSDFVRRFQMLQDITNQDVSIVEAVSYQKALVEERWDTWEIRREEAAEWRREVAARNDSLAATVAHYESRLTQLNNQQQEYRAAMDEMERRSEQIARDITEKQRELALAEGVPYLQWPLDRGTYWVSSPYGSRYHPVLGQWRLHTGVDLAASPGTTIRAGADGIVLDAGWMGGYGLTVIIAHTTTVSTLYAHGSSVLVNAGQRVTAGQAIARVGTTGWSTGPHLHFEVRVNGDPKDPLKYLPGR